MISHRHKCVMDGIVMHVVQSSQIGTLVGEPGFALVVPDLAALGAVVTIDPASSAGVQFAQNVGERIGIVARRVGDEVIVIGKNGPSFELP